MSCCQYMGSRLTRLSLAEEVDDWTRKHTTLVCGICNIAHVLLNDLCDWLFSVLPFCSLSTLRFLDWLCELLDTWISPRGWIKNQYIYPSYRESVQLQILGHTHLRELIMDNKHHSNSKESTAVVILSPHTQESQSLTTAPKVLLALLHRECAHLRNPVVVW